MIAGGGKGVSEVGAPRAVPGTGGARRPRTLLLAGLLRGLSQCLLLQLPHQLHLRRLTGDFCNQEELGT